MRLIDKDKVIEKTKKLEMIMKLNKFDYSLNDAKYYVDLEKVIEVIESMPEVDTKKLIDRLDKEIKTNEMKAILENEPHIPEKAKGSKNVITGLKDAKQIVLEVLDNKCEVSDE